MDPIYILFTRILWSAVFGGVLIIFNRKINLLKQSLKDKKQLLIIAICAILITINWGAYIYAVSIGHIMDASLAYYMNPLLSIAIAFLFLQEKLSYKKWIGVVVAFLGILYTIIEYGTFPYLALIIGGSFAIYGALKKYVRYEAVISMFLETLIVSPVALIYILYKEINGVGYLGSITDLRLLLFPIAGVVTAIPLILYAKGVTKIPYSLSGILMYVNPTLQLIISIVIYNEKFTKSNLIMFICVWIALVLFLSDRKNKG